MTLTEDEARKKLCHNSFGTAQSGGYEQHPGGGSSWSPSPAGFKCRCIASECMAWRWLTAQHEENGTIWKATGPFSAVGVKEHLGYCGLAGKP